MNFLSERGKILNNGIVSVNIILNKKLDILKSELHTKGFPFEFDKEFIQEQIKESLLNKILFMKDEMNEHSLHDQLEDIAKKLFPRIFLLNQNFSFTYLLYEVFIFLIYCLVDNFHDHTPN